MRRRRLAVQSGILGSIAAVILFLGLFPVTVPAGNTNPSLAGRAVALTGVASSAPGAAAGTIEAGPVPLAVVAPRVSSDALPSVSDQTTATFTQIAAQQMTDGAEGSVSALRSSEQLPLFYRYEVQTGDSVGSIADRFGISSQYILWNNVDIISDQDLLEVGLRLQVPSVEGIIHSVRVGETLGDIAAQYDAEVADIIAFPANGLADPNLLTEGTQILVPGGRVVPAAAPALRPGWVDNWTPPAAAESADGGATDFVDREPSGLGFIWPVVDLITSYFGPSHPLGIDVNAPYVPIAAAAAGQVVFAGGDPCCSYGIYVDIVHADGYETRYAHLSSLSVGLGQWVEQGQLVGVSGITGRATGPHLHFELRRNGVIQNPLLYLP